MSGTKPTINIIGHCTKISKHSLKALFFKCPLSARYQTNFVAGSRVPINNTWSTDVATANEACVNCPFDRSYSQSCLLQPTIAQSKAEKNIKSKTQTRITTYFYFRRIEFILPQNGVVSTLTTEERMTKTTN